MGEVYHVGAGQAAPTLTNPEGEYRLLCTLLRDRQALETAADLLTVDDFSDEFMGRVFGIMAHEASLNREANAVTLRPILEKDPAFAQFGGWGALAAMGGDTLSLLYDWRGIAQDIKRYSRRRKMVAGLLQAVALAEDDTGTDDALLEAADAALAKVTDEADASSTYSAAQCGAEYVASLSAPRIPGITCGSITPLDDAIGPMRRTHLVIGAGRPGMGKTATAISYAIGAARNGHGVLLITIEMSRGELTERILADMCFAGGNGILYENIRDRELIPAETRTVCRASEELSELPLYIHDTSRMTIGKLDRVIRRFKRRMEAQGKSLDLVIVDYLQLIGSDDRKANRFETVTEVSNGLKRLAKSHDVAMFALSQLSREVEKRPDKRPMLSDLRESGSIEQDADTIVFFFRLEYYLRQSEPDAYAPEHDDWQAKVAACTGGIDFHCAKRRHGKGNVHRKGTFHAQYQAVR